MELTRSQRHLVEFFGTLGLAALVLLGLRILLTDSTRYIFIPGNLALAWAGLLLGWGLARQMSRMPWTSAPVIGLLLLWLFFLPNTWYTVTDFLHVFPTGEIGELYDITLMFVFVFNCFSMGLVSLYSVHKQLIKKLGPSRAYAWVQGVILLASFAIYIGRILRWNSWDAITNASGLLVNVSDRLINPLAHPASLNITGLFFIFISAVYFAFWRAAKILDEPSK